MEDTANVKKYLKTILKTQKNEKDDISRTKDYSQLQKITIHQNTVPPSKTFIPSVVSTQFPPQKTHKWKNTNVCFTTNPSEELLFPQIKSWIDTENEQKLAYFTKYNINFRMPNITVFEINQFHQTNSLIWSGEEILHIFHLLELFEGNFELVFDRYSDSEEFIQRSLEDIKEQAFLVCKLITESKNGDSTNELKLFQYNKNYDRLRKLKTEKYYQRTDHIQKQEEVLMTEIKNLEVSIKKKEKENNNFKKIIDLTKDEKLEFDENVNPNIDFISKQGFEQNTQSIAFSRSGFIKGPLYNLPPLTNKKLEFALKELEIPTNIYATESNIKLLERLRLNILKLLQMNSIFQQKEKLLKKLKDGKKPKNQNVENQSKQFEIKSDGISLKRIKDE